MSHDYRSLRILAASLVCGILSLATVAAFADATPGNLAGANATMRNISVDGRYHSVTNGISDYDGFDRFRDATGQPLPTWEQELRSPG
ncbi:MAG TPA: hypothetical protein VGP48_12445 [Stellaceae bacterium]|jgi:hypothetical protein|nr:hypothetical protein [Stellaceae bacterium]